MSSQYDYDRPHDCPTCGEPLQVSLPCWLTPGQDFEPEVDYEAEPKGWFCPNCQEHHDTAEPREEVAV